MRQPVSKSGSRGDAGVKLGVRGCHITLFHDQGHQGALSCTMGVIERTYKKIPPKALAQVPGRACTPHTILAKSSGQAAWLSERVAPRPECMNRRGSLGMLLGSTSLAPELQSLVLGGGQLESSCVVHSPD